MTEPTARIAGGTGAERPLRLEARSLGCDEAAHPGRRPQVDRCLPAPSPWRSETLSCQELHPSGRGEATTTARPVFSIAVTRELATVVVTLGGPLESGNRTALRDLLWDLVVGQGNLTVILDARDLVVSDPVLVADLTVLRREAANRGGTLVVLDQSSFLAPPAERSPGTPLDFSRARRSARRGMAEHPAGGARTRHRTTRGAQDDPM
jgi:hypothetical protein